MSETATPTPAAAKVAKPKVEKVAVTMTDSRVVEFPISRKIQKEVLLDAAGAPIGVRFDFFNGETRTLLLAEVNAFIANYSACHGLGQKVGDEWSGVMKQGGTIEDIVLTCDQMFTRLRGGAWDAESTGTGDSMAGATVIIKALVEVTKRDAAWVKAFLEKMLEDGKATGLTRQKMYASFRDPKSQVGQVIRRLEEEKAAANASFNADDVAAQMLAAA
jgi:hypothetical protein